MSVGDAVTEILGYAPDELINRHMFEIVHPDDLERSKAGFAESVRRQDKAVRAIDVRLLNKDGDTRHFELHRRLFFDDDGNVTGGEGIARGRHRPLRDAGAPASLSEAS